MDPTLTNADKLLLAAMQLCEGDLAKTFTAEELAVTAWSADKTSFGLRGYEDRYPDSNKLFKSIDSKGGLVVKGLIVKVGDRTFRLSAGGIAAGSLLGPQSPEKQLRLERELATAVSRLVEHPVFREWIKDRSKPTKFGGAGQFWGVAPGTPERIARGRINSIETTLEEALQYMQKQGVDVLFKEKDKPLCERVDVERCLEFHAVLKERFSRELGLLMPKEYGSRPTASRGSEVMSNQDQQIKQLLEREFSVTVRDVQTERDSDVTYAKFSLRGGRILTVTAAWDASSTLESVAEELARQSREHPERQDEMDLNRELWPRLRANGHEVGQSYIQVGAGQRVVVDGVAMSLSDAQAVADKRTTVAEVAARLARS